MKFLTLFSDG